MGLDYEQKRVILKEGEKPSNFIVIDVRDYTLNTSKTLQEWSIELLGLIRRANQANNIYRMHGSKNRICTEILHQAIDAIMIQTPLNDTEIREYFKRRVEITKFYNGYIDLIRPNGLDLNAEIDYFLLGKEFDIENDDIPNSLKWPFSTLLYDLETDKIKLDDFIQKSRELIEQSIYEVEVDE
ncbi:hypothetical protein N9Y48_00240 [Zobellia sp.]|nr:hypothetical protein [Zobellia sp.]